MVASISGGENTNGRHINSNNSSVDAIKCSNLQSVFLTTNGTKYNLVYVYEMKSVSVTDRLTLVYIA